MSLFTGLLAFDDQRYARKAGSCPDASRLAFFEQSFFNFGKEQKMSETDNSDTVRKVGTFIGIVLSGAIYVLAIGPLVYNYL
jgi:hypothetical protein